MVAYFSNIRSHLSFAANQPMVLPMDHHMYSTPTEETVTPDMEGWLHKQGCRYKKWNKRWFVLKGPNLFYFKSPKVNNTVWHSLF